MIPDPSLYTDWKEWAKALQSQGPTPEANALVDQALIAPIKDTIVPRRKRQVVVQFKSNTELEFVALCPDGTQRKGVVTLT